MSAILEKVKAGHIGVDHKSGIVHSVKTTTAKIHDKDMQNDLLHGEEKAIFGDKGYCKEEDKREMRERGIFCGILDKAKINHPLSKVRYKGLLKNTMQLNVLFGMANLYMSRRKLIKLMA